MIERSQASGGVAVIVQARMGSSRLPGKTMEPLGDRLVIDWVMERLRSASLVTEVLVATTDLVEDDVLVEHLRGQGVFTVRGSPDDVLSRYVRALDDTSAQILARVTADCPFIDPGIVDLGVTRLVECKVDYAATGLDGRFPRGLDAEVFTREALTRADAETVNAEEREHVTPFIYRNPDIFRCTPIVAPGWAARPDLRFTLDEPADLDVLNAVIEALSADPTTPTRDIIDFLDKHPEVVAMNASVEHRTVEF